MWRFPESISLCLCVRCGKVILPDGIIILRFRKFCAFQSCIELPNFVTTTSEIFLIQRNFTTYVWLFLKFVYRHNLEAVSYIN